MYSFAPIADYASEPVHRGRLLSADGVGSAGQAGVFGAVVVTVQILHGKIAEARHDSSGCGYTVACASLLLDWAIGRDVDECLKLSAEDFVANVPGVPTHKRHCPLLAIHALHEALHNARQ